MRYEQKVTWTLVPMNRTDSGQLISGERQVHLSGAGEGPDGEQVTLNEEQTRIPMDRLVSGAIPGQFQSVDDLAGVLLFVLLGLAIPFFPRTTKAGPSDIVRVIRSADKSPGLSVPGFPVDFDWRTWHKIIVPVLQDARVRLAGVLSSIRRGILDPSYVLSRPDEYLNRVGSILRQKYEEEGRLPPAPSGSCPEV
jgi:hypothetical protein